MPNKKGRKVAASRERARAAARRKARSGGPDIPQRTAQTPTAPQSTQEEDDQTPAQQPVEALEAQSAVAERPAAARTAYRQRRQRDAALATGPSVTRELLRIGVIMLVIAVVLIALKLGTPLGT